MRTTTTIAKVTGILVLATATLARAEDRFAVTGTHDARGAFTSEVSLDEQGGRVAVRERVRWADGVEEAFAGTGAKVGDAIEAHLARIGNLADGIVPDLSQDVTARLVVTGDALDLRATDAQGARQGAGARVAGPSRARALADTVGRHLLALGQKEVDGAASRGVRLDREFALGSFVHVGLIGGVRAIPAKDWSLDQQASARRSGGRAAWIVSDVGGAARVNFGASIPLGSVSLGVGLEAGARVRHEVTDLTEIPADLRDEDAWVAQLRDLGKRTFDLPLSAEDARAMAPGARHVLEGEMTAAVSGSLSIGREVTSYGDDVVRVGASAWVSGFWRVTGALRCEVTRLPGEAVRLRVTRTATDARGANAEVLLGATLDQDAFKHRLEPRLEYVSPVARPLVAGAVAGEAARLVQDAVRIQITGGISRTTQDQLDLSYRFDLAQGPARAAYDRAVRGDLTQAAAACADPASGVTQEHRVLAVEERTWLGAELQISVLLRAGASRTIRAADLDVEDPRVGGDGRARYEVFSFARERHLEVRGAQPRRRAVAIDVLRCARADGETQRSLRWTLDADDPTTTDQDANTVRRALAGWGLNDASGLPLPEGRPFHSRYGMTRTRLSVEIGTSGLAKILQASDEELLQAYVEAFTTIAGDVPTWATESGRSRLEFAGNDEGSNVQQEKQQMRSALAFVKGVRALIKGPDAATRAAALKSLSSTAGYDLYAISALLRLSPRQSVRLSGSMRGERIAVEDRFDGPDFAAVTVIDPR